MKYTHHNGSDMQLSQIADHHRAASGHHAQSSETNPKHLVSFESFLDFSIPAFHHPPDMKAQKAKLDEDKASAINSLNMLFQQIFENNSGVNS